MAVGGAPVTLVGPTGTPIDASSATIAGPLGTQTIAASVAVTPATSSTWTAAGPVATLATASGNPVGVAGVIGTGTTGLAVGTDGQVQRFLLNTGGALGIAAMDFGGTAGSDARGSLYGFSSRTGVGPTPIPVAVGGFLLGGTNGTTWDRARGNYDTAALITAAAAVVGVDGADQTNYNGRGVQVVLDMTVVGSGSVTLTIQGKDAASGKYYTLLAGAAVVTNSTNLYTVYPGAAVTANVSSNSPLPRTWRVITTANNANAATYTVSASVIV